MRPVISLILLLCTIATAHGRFYYDSMICGTFSHVKSLRTSLLTPYEFDEDGRITRFSGMPVADIKRISCQVPESLTLENGTEYNFEWDSAGRLTRITCIGMPLSMITDFTYTGNDYYPATSDILMTGIMQQETKQAYSGYQLNSRGDWVKRLCKNGTNTTSEGRIISYWDETPQYNAWEWEVPPALYRHIDDFSEGLAQVALGHFYGFIDKTGRIAIPALTDFHWEVGDFHCGMAYVCDSEHLGYIDNKGNIAISPTYSRLKDYPYGENFVDGLAIVNTSSSESYFGDNYITLDNRKLLPQPTNGNPKHFQEGIANTGYGFIDTSGNYVYKFPQGYEGSMYCENGLFTVRKLKPGSYFDAESAALVDKTGKSLTGFDFQDLRLFKSPEYILARNNSKWGAIDRSGTVVMPYEYDRVVSAYSGSAVLEKNGENYIVAKDMTATRVPYNDINILGNGLYSFRDPSTDLWGMIDSKGTQIRPAEFGFIKPVSEGFIGFHKDNKVGYMDTRGQIVIPAVYDLIYDKHINDFHDGMAVVGWGKHMGVISAKKHYGSPKTAPAPKKKATGKTTPRRRR